MLTLSVVIPNYNNGRYLKKCIQSIMNQTYLPMEIIVVDDCSTDDSLSIIEELALECSIIHPVFLQTNGGVSAARNIGISTAQGEYITVIDADDFYFSEKKLENEMALIELGRKKGKDILAYSVTTIVDKYGVILPGNFNKRWYRNQFIHGRSFVQLVSMNKQYRIPRDYCIKKEIITQVGIYSFYKNFYEDLDLLMRLAEHGIDFYCTFVYGTAYRKTENGLSTRKEKEHLETRQEIRCHYYKKLNRLQKVECRCLMINHYLWTNFKKRILLPIKSFLKD